MRQGRPIHGDRPNVTLEDVLSGTCSAPECEAESFEDAPFPICPAHYIEIVRHFQSYKSAVAVESLPWAEEARDEVGLADGVALSEQPRSSLVDHVHRFDSLQRSPRTLKGDFDTLNWPTSIL